MHIYILYIMYHVHTLFRLLVDEKTKPKSDGVLRCAFEVFLVVIFKWFFMVHF